MGLKRRVGTLETVQQARIVRIAAAMRDFYSQLSQAELEAIAALGNTPEARAHEAQINARLCDHIRDRVGPVTEEETSLADSIIARGMLDDFLTMPPDEQVKAISGFRSLRELDAAEAWLCGGGALVPHLVTALDAERLRLASG